MRSRTRRRSTSSFVSPGPRPPIPPARRESEVSRCARRGSRYPSCASSTWSLPSRVEARWAKMSRISWVRSITRRSRRSARLRAWLGVRSPSKITRSTSSWKQRITSSWSLPAPITVRGSTWGRCWVSTATTETPAERASSRELFEGGVELLGAAAAAHDHEDRPLAGADLVHRRRARELLLERADPVLEVEVDLRGRQRGQQLDAAAVAVRRQQRRAVGASRQALLVGGDAHHRVEAQLREVGEVVLGEPLVREVGVDAAQPAQASPAGAHASPVRQLDRAGIADHHVGDRPGAVDEHPHLPADLPGELRELAGEVVGQEPVGRKAALREALELLDVVGLEAVGITEDAYGYGSCAGRAGSAGRFGG